MTRETQDVLIARNPATHAELARISTTPPEQVPELVRQAREAQRDWADRPWRERRAALKYWHRELERNADSIAKAVCEEIGKPRCEAMAAEVVPSLDAIQWTIRSAGRLLKARTESPGSQRWLLMPRARIEQRPLGVIGAIGAWNYPILLNVPVIAHAIASGNAIVWKPSELSSRCGALLQETIERSGLPSGLVAIVQGGPEVGEALIKADIDKAVFTGGMRNGHRVLGILGARGIPAIAELSGFDAAVVLEDAPDERTMSALRWSAFLGAGQACMSVKRIFLVGRPAGPWVESFARKVEELRIGDPSRNDIDMGPMISEQARDSFHQRVQAAIDAGAQVFSGAEPLRGPGWFYRPTVLLAEVKDDAPERALEGCFGPVVIVRAVRDVDEAVAAVNVSRFGLSASVWGRDRRQLHAVASRLQVGVVGVNEATTFFAQVSAPAGGVKASGFGRVHGAEGLKEMTSPRTVVARSFRSPRLQVFPYSGRLERLLKIYRRFEHR